MQNSEDIIGRFPIEIKTEIRYGYHNFMRQNCDNKKYETFYIGFNFDWKLTYIFEKREVDFRKAEKLHFLIYYI